MLEFPGEHLFAFWGLLLLVVPLVASGLGGGESRADRFFFGSCVLVTLLLFAAMPRGGLAPGVALTATLAWSGIVAAVYLACSPSARRVWRGLLFVLALVDASALLAVYLGRALGAVGLTVLLAVTAACVGSGAVWALRRIGRARHARPH